MSRLLRYLLLGAGLATIGPIGSESQTKPRSRDLGIALDGTPGPGNAITDVPGVEVGFKTIILGSGKLEPGKGPIRTGVTAILPRGKTDTREVYAAWSALNGAGEMTGTTWVEESGMLNGPVMITNTHSVGAIHQGTIQWALTVGKEFAWSTPVVAETWDGGLNDINGFHLTPADAIAAIKNAKSGPVEEGNVGGGTGMTCHQFKGGTGTSSRQVSIFGNIYLVGVLAQCNYGTRSRFAVAGAPVGREIPDLLPCFAALPDGSYAGKPTCESGPGEELGDGGSIIVVAATNVPLLPHQLKRIARRVALGIGRIGGIGGDSSGDIFIAFSTANPEAVAEDRIVTVQAIPNPAMNSLFEATIDATSEAILNAMLAAETMTGVNGRRIYALPTDRLTAALRKYGRLR